MRWMLPAVLAIGCAATNNRKTSGGFDPDAFLVEPEPLPAECQGPDQDEVLRRQRDRAIQERRCTGDDFKENWIADTGSPPTVEEYRAFCHPIMERWRRSLDHEERELERCQDLLAARRRKREVEESRNRLSAMEAEHARRKERAALIRSVGETIGAGFSASAQTASPPPTYSAAPASEAAGDDGCSSDFSCGIGRRCVKKNFSSRGVCMKTVDESGVRTYQQPSVDSVGPKMPSKGDCQFSTDCPAGFRCDAKSGACTK